MVTQGHREGRSLRTGKGEMGNSTESPVEVGAMNSWWLSPCRMVVFPRSAQSQSYSKGQDNEGFRAYKLLFCLVTLEGS